MAPRKPSFLRTLQRAVTAALIAGSIVVFIALASEPGFLWFAFAFVVVVAGVGVAAWLWRSRRKRTRYQQLMELLALTPRQFERAVADLLHDLGYRRVEIVGKSGDLAADLLAVDQNGRTVAVQCKRYAPGTKIGSPEIQKFIGMVTVHHRVDRGIFVTTTQFSEPARSLAEQHSLELFDGSRLSATLATLADRRQRLA